MTNKLNSKPFIKFLGGKRQLIGKLDSNLPNNKFKTYIEPMVGGGALLFHILEKKEFIEKAVICDINEELINCYLSIKNNLNDLSVYLSKIQDEYLKCDEIDKLNYFKIIKEIFNKRFENNIDKNLLSAYFIFLNKTCFNGMYRINRKNEFNVPFGRIYTPKIFDEENLLSVNLVLQKVDILVGDYSNVISHIDNNSFVYIDPPYKPISKSSSFNHYHKNNFDDSEQIRLSGFCKYINSTGSKFMLSNSDLKNFEENSFFDDIYSEFNIIRIDAKRLVNAKSENRNKTVKEIIVKNY